MDRMRLAAAWLLLLILASAAPALGFNEPESFRGAAWGASEAEVQEKIGGKLDCIDVPELHRWLSDRTCSAPFDLGGERGSCLDRVRRCAHARGLRTGATLSLEIEREEPLP
jgi:hypothetical protein